MAWVIVETNQGEVILRAYTDLFNASDVLETPALENTVVSAVIAAERIEKPLENDDVDS